MSTSRNDLDADEVKFAVQGLMSQANMLSLTHLRDPLVQQQFRDEYRFLGKCLINDYNNGILVRDKLVSHVKQERQSLIDQAAEIGKYGIGLIAGAGQLSAGYGLCVTSSIFSFAGASWCTSVGAPMMAHGGNNIYENSYNITGNVVQNWKNQYTGDYGDGSGWVRKKYRNIASALGMDERDGDLAYAGVDLATSAYGLANTVKTVPNANVPDAKQFKLFYHLAQDYSKGWKTMSGGALANEIVGDTITLSGAISPYFVEKKE